MVPEWIMLILGVTTCFILKHLFYKIFETLEERKKSLFRWLNFKKEKYYGKKDSCLCECPLSFLHSFPGQSKQQDRWWKLKYTKEFSIDVG